MSRGSADLTLLSTSSGRNRDGWLQRLRGGGLALKMVAATFPIIAAIVLATQLAIGITGYENQSRALESRAELIARLTSEAIARPLWNLDKPVYESQISAIARDTAFVGAEILDLKGQRILSYGAPAGDSEDITVTVPVIEPSSEPPTALAELRLTMSRGEIAAGVRHQLMIGLIAFAVLLLGFFLIVQLFLRRLVLQPLNILLNAMGRVERKEWQTAEWSSTDELGRVTGAFNRMVDALRSGDEAQRLLRELTIVQQALTENNSQLERANKLVLDSINYARRIQTALLPDPGAIGSSIADIAVEWKPRDIVGGDFYWMGEVRGRIVLVLADCTGHGVPGAFMTMIVASALDRVLQESGSDDPALLLAEIDRLVRTLLRQDREDGQNRGESLSDDGLDAAICVYDPPTRELRYAGAMIPLILVSPTGEARQVRADRHGLGYRTGRRGQPFTCHTMDLERGTALYLASDGVIDQFSARGTLFGRRRLTDTLLAARDRPMSEQIAAVAARLAAYRGGEPCPDDVTLLACRFA